MFIRRLVRLIKRLPWRIQQRVDRFGAQYTAYGLFGAINAPLYYLIWLYFAKESYENLGLRLLCGLLCSVLLLHRHWPRRIKSLLPLYWYLTLLVTLPFFFTILLLLNHGSAMWMANTIVMVFLMLLLVDSHSAIVLLVLGTVLGAAGVMLWQHDVMSFIKLMEYRGFLVTYGISLVIGTLFSHNREQIETLKRKAIQVAAECQEKSVFIANISHDLRTPLAGLLNIAEVSAQQLSLNHPLQANIQLIQQSATQLQQLLEQLLAVVQLNRGNSEILQEIFSMETLLAELQQLFAPALQQKQLVFYLKNTTTIGSLKGPIHLMKRTLIHLISNAIHFTDQGSITVEYSVLNSNQLTISIIDTGCGINREDQALIFKSFKKIIPSYQQAQYQGAGLGLYLSRQMMTRVGGSVTVESLGEGVGSTFTCTIPIERVNATQRITLKNKKNRADLIEMPLNRILLVEDNIIVQISTQKLLQQWQPQCIVDTTATVAGTIQLTTQQRYDLILLDIGLPDGSGRDAARSVRTLAGSQNKKTPIVAVTAHVDPSRLASCLQAGINSVFNKPLTFEKLRTILAEFFPLEQWYPL